MILSQRQAGIDRRQHNDSVGRPKTSLEKRERGDVPGGWGGGGGGLAQRKFRKREREEK